MTRTKTSFVMLLALVAMVACAQESIQWPDAGSIDVGECGEDYPDATYQVKQDAVMPCLEFDKTWYGPYDSPTQITLDLKEVRSDYVAGDFDGLRELFRSGAGVNPRFIVVIHAALNCGPCALYIADINDNMSALEGVGAAVIGQCSTNIENNTVTVDECRTQLSQDGWQEDRLRIYDEDGYLMSSIVDFPYTQIIDLDNMVMLGMGSAGVDGYNGASVILDIINDAL